MLLLWIIFLAEKFGQSFLAPSSQSHWPVIIKAFTILICTVLSTFQKLNIVKWANTDFSHMTLLALKARQSQSAELDLSKSLHVSYTETPLILFVDLVACLKSIKSEIMLKNEQCFSSLGGHIKLFRSLNEAGQRKQRPNAS